MQISKLLFSGTYNKYPYQEKPLKFYHIMKCGPKLWFKNTHTQATFYMCGSEKDNIDNIHNHPSSYYYILQ